MIAIVVAIVVAMLPFDHDRGAVPVMATQVAIPMPVSLADPNSRVADPDINPLRDDDWLVDDD